MNLRRYTTPLAFLLAIGTLVLALGPTAPATLAHNPPPAPAVANWVTNGNSVANKDFIGTTNNKALVFKTNNAEQMRILSNGNIGIGIKTPGSKLSVAGLVESTSGGFKFPDGTTQTTANTAGPNGWGLNGNASTNPFFSFLGTTDNQSLVFRTNNVERVRIDTIGNVGIGTPDPTQTLAVSGTTLLGAQGSLYGYMVPGASPGPYPTLGFNTYGDSYNAGTAG